MKVKFKKMLYNIHYNNVIINCKYLIIFYAFINSFVSIILSFLGFIIVIRPIIFWIEISLLLKTFPLH